MKVTRVFGFATISWLLAAALFTTSCGKTSTTNHQSDILVSDVDHTDVKRQSIGNCWIYATTTWAESLHKSATGEEVNLSESYLTYWHFRSQIMQGVNKIETGGFFYTSSNILLKQGYMLEGDFIPAEADMEMSQIQRQAEEYLNAELSTGSLRLRKNRTVKNIDAALAKAFGVEMATVTDKVRKASELVVGKNADGSDKSLSDALAGDASQRWMEVYYPRMYDTSAPSRTTKQARVDLLRRVMRAVNDRQPVIMTMMIDFNALDAADVTFKTDNVGKPEQMGHQGGHMVALEDYTVRNVPGVGDIGEGDVSDELKAKALTGDLATIKVKNSWGKNRPDRGLTDGYTRFTIEYLDAALPWRSGSDETKNDNYNRYTTLTNFLLPPGY